MSPMHLLSCISRRAPRARHLLSCISCHASRARHLLLMMHAPLYAIKVMRLLPPLNESLVVSLPQPWPGSLGRGFNEQNKVCFKADLKAERYLDAILCVMYVSWVHSSAARSVENFPRGTLTASNDTSLHFQAHGRTHGLGPVASDSRSRTLTGEA